MTYSLANKKVLVLGASGLVGMNIVPKLVERGAKVFVACHSNNRAEHIHKDKIAGCFNFNIDLRDRNHCDRIVKDMDVVMHLAASTSGAAVMGSTPLVHVTPNIIMNANILEAAYFSDVDKVVWLASTTGYPVVEKAVEEDMFIGDPYEKYFAVGWVKRYTEKLCELYGKLEDRLPCLVLRPTNIYGPYDKFDPKKSHVLPALMRKVIERQNPIEVWGDGTDERDLIYVSDMVDAIISATETLHEYLPLNIGSGTSVSVNEMLRMVLEIEDYSPTVSYVHDKPRMIPKRSVDVSKAKNVLGFTAKVPLEEGIQKTIEWYKEYYEAADWKK